MAEEWRPVVGYEGRYEVSSHGRVRSLVTDRIRKLDRKPSGYFYVPLSDGKTSTKHYVHRLVATAFCERLPGQTVVRHLDDNPENNHVSNLAWGTQVENAADAIKNGRNSFVNRTHCSKGHEFTPENTMPRYDNPHGRRCRTCRNELMRRRWARTRRAA